jgi:protein-disulfide isomerase-like protein with CxxC motif
MFFRNKTLRQDAIRKVMAGMTKHYGDQQVIRLAGHDFDPAALQAFLEAAIASSDATVQARAAWAKAVDAERANRAETSKVLGAIRHLVLGNHGDSMAVSEELAAFGFAPRSPRKVTSAENVDAAAKRKATRKARGTLGKKARLKIHGAPELAPAPPAPQADPNA